MDSPRRQRLLTTLVGCLSVALALGCSTPAFKPDALDREVLSSLPAAGLLRDGDGDIPVVLPGPAWMRSNALPGEDVFVGWRVDDHTLRFGLVKTLEPSSDVLELWLLPDGVSPLEASPADRERPADVVTTVSAALAERRFDIPIARPKNIYAVAANFPSHLEHDLALDDVESKRSTMERARPRVFRKFPATRPPTGDDAGLSGFVGIVGPMEGLSIPSEVVLPPERAGTPATRSAPNVDYEVEVGLVVGKKLGSEAARTLTDDELWAAVAGWVLISDAKVRNPQVVQKLVTREQEIPPRARPYAFGDDAMDSALGRWDPETCAWWSYAASAGNYAAIGPIFVRRSGQGRLPPRAVVSARSYEGEGLRREAAVGGLARERLQLRQASKVTSDAGEKDRIVWDVPQILRSILEEDSVLLADGEAPALLPGDVVCLGTPGGTVITARSEGVVELLSTFLSTWTPLDWHDVFFGDDEGLYLRAGDHLFLWAEGLGFQLHRIRTR